MTEEFAKHGEKLDPTGMNNTELWAVANVILDELQRRARITSQLVAIEDMMETQRMNRDMQREDDRADCGCCGAPLEGKGVSRVAIVYAYGSATKRGLTKFFVVCMMCARALDHGQTTVARTTSGVREYISETFERVRRERCREVANEA